MNFIKLTTIWNVQLSIYSGMDNFITNLSLNLLTKKFSNRQAFGEANTTVWCLVFFDLQCTFVWQLICVNAAGVAGDVTPNIWPAGVVLCWRSPIFWQVFYFFPSAEVLNTASRCHCHLHHIRPFWNEKFLNFLGRGTAPPQTPPPSPPTALRFLRLRRSTCDPPCSSGVDARVAACSSVWIYQSVFMNYPGCATHRNGR